MAIHARLTRPKRAAVGDDELGAGCALWVLVALVHGVCTWCDQSYIERDFFLSFFYIYTGMIDVLIYSGFHTPKAVAYHNLDGVKTALCWVPYAQGCDLS